MHNDKYSTTFWLTLAVVSFVASVVASSPSYPSDLEEATLAADLPDKRGWSKFHGGYGKRGWNSFNGGYGKRASNVDYDEDFGSSFDPDYVDPDKRAWNSGFAGGMGKRAWNSGFAGGIGKRAWNSFAGGYGKRGWNSFAGGYGKRAWNGFTGGYGKRNAELPEGGASATK